MLHDLDNSDEEPDFTHVDLTKRCNEPEAADTEECDRLPRKYAPDDLLSEETDPSCKANWFLAAYWPVYVGNFKVDKWVEDTWYEQVSNYFAYNGLLTRMIYIHHQPNDKAFSKYQRQCMLIDMLVYFTSKADADRAIATCHRDPYFGYKLIVLPGRDPIYFNKERCVRFAALGDSCKFTPLETVMENALSRHGPVTFAGRYPNEIIILEFVSIQAMVAAVASQFRWKPSPLKQEFMKQRFIEEDVKLDIEWAKESNPTFMDMQPKPSVLVHLFEGVRPNVSPLWKGHETYVKAPVLLKLRKETNKRMRMLAFNKKYKIQKPKKPETEIVTRDPALPPPKTRRQNEADNMKSINWFLRYYGAAPISRATVRDVQMKVQKQMQGK
ncbi:uncharacterized protein LOC135710014 [Ochlerotatus camptorhynchus]|uniref:uncharacterized protein LOC135710014 n=1 Tax=Ochlerotatus camptorhynchus TaxID=644619 RepID=UPI0031CFEBD8